MGGEEKGEGFFIFHFLFRFLFSFALGYSFCQQEKLFQVVSVCFGSFVRSRSRFRFLKKLYFLSDESVSFLLRGTEILEGIILY